MQDEEKHMLYSNLSTNDAGHLCFAGLDVCDLAKEFGTPLYLLDEDRVRENCRTYVQAVKKYLPEGSMPLFASKALCFKGIYPIIASEGMGADVVSGGEAATALAAGFPADLLYFHGTNKTDDEIAYGVANGIGTFGNRIIDIELDALQIDGAAADGGELGGDEVEARNERHLLVPHDVGGDDLRGPCGQGGETALPTCPPRGGEGAVCGGLPKMRPMRADAPVTDGLLRR